MKPQRFEIGQAVTPINNEGIHAQMFGKVFTVQQYHSFHADPLYGWQIGFNETPPKHYFAEDAFTPLISDSDLARELESIEVPQTI